MEPLNAYEIQELLATLGQGTFPIPIGSLWSNAQADKMFMVLHHANTFGEFGPVYSLVLQSLPDGSAWVIPTEEFMNSDWQNVGFIWDRNAHA